MNHEFRSNKSNVFHYTFIHCLVVLNMFYFSIQLNIISSPTQSHLTNLYMFRRFPGHAKKTPFESPTDTEAGCLWHHHQDWCRALGSSHLYDQNLPVLPVAWRKQCDASKCRQVLGSSGRNSVLTIVLTIGFCM